MTLAFAHGGIELGAGEVAQAAAGGAAGPWQGPHVSLLTDWTFDPVFLIPLALALLYFKGYLRYRRRGGRRFPAWRPVLFGLGIALVALALLSPIDTLADYSFTFHMLQHDLLMLVAVPLILLGAPFVPVVRGLPPGLRRRLFVPLARNGLVRHGVLFMTRPLVGLVLFVFTVVAWHVPGLYDAALHNEWVHYGEHLSFIVTALCFWWHIVTPYPFPSRLHTFLRMLMLVASAIVNEALCAMIVFAPTVLYGYGALQGFWGFTMLEDQNLGALIMWIMGDLLRLGVISILFALYAQQENAKELAGRAPLPAGRLAQST